MAKVTIETPELTISKTVARDGHVAEANVVEAIVALVDAYDAAHSYKSHSVRAHLIAKLRGE
jgi:hypothetical protein